MKKWIKDNDVLLRSFSLLIAIVLWAYVVGTGEQTKVQTISNVPVQLQGVGTLTDKNLVILSGANSKVALTVEGPSSDILNLLSDLTGFSVTASLESITEPGEYELDYSAEAKGFSSVKITSKSPKRLTLVVDRMSTASVPVEVVLTGTPADGHTIADYTVSPDAITVRGPETVLRQIERAKVVYDVSGLDASLQTNVTFTLLDDQGNEVTNPFLAPDMPSTTLDITLKRNNAIPLTVEFSENPYLTDDLFDYVIEPDSLELLGSPEIMQELNQISLGTIDLMDVITEGKLSFEKLIVLPNGVSAAEGQRQYAVVTLTLKDCAWRTLELDQSVLKVDALLNYPDQVFSLSVFGATSRLDSLAEQSILVEPVYELDDLVAGENVIQAKVTLPDGGLYARQDVMITVHVTQEALDEARNPEPPVDPGTTPDEP